MSEISIMADIQSKLVVIKDKNNKFGGYNYRTAKDILEAVKPLLKAHNCHVKLTDEVIMVGERYYIKATATVSQGSKVIQSASALAREPNEQKGMVAPMLTGACSSYARKYCLSGMFAIDNNEDVDAIEQQSETIDDAQLKVLTGLIKKTKTDKAQFLKFIKEDSLEFIPVTKYARAEQALKGKDASHE